MNELTDWFTGIKPTQVGVYQRDLPNSWGKCFTWWNGEHFCYLSEHPAGAEKIAKERGFLKSVHQSAPWRGLDRNPEGGMA